MRIACGTPEPWHRSPWPKVQEIEHGPTRRSPGAALSTKFLLPNSIRNEIFGPMENATPLRIVFALSAAVCATLLSAQVVVVYSNQFITPLIATENAPCQQDFSAQLVNDLWAGTGLGTSPGSFIQQATIETILVTGPADVYDDPSGIGGDYALGILRPDAFSQGDMLGLLIDTEGLPFVNIAMDMSAINTTCGGPLALDTCVFLAEVLDAPGGIFDLVNGVALDADTLVGIEPAMDTFVFNWARASGTLDVSGSTDGQVAIRIQQMRSLYSAFDNIYIEASSNIVINAVPEVDALALKLAPNPCIDVLTLSGIAQVQVVRIHNLLGVQVATLQMDRTGRIDVSALPAGAYVLQVQQGKTMRSLRFVKE